MNEQSTDDSVDTPSVWPAPPLIPEVGLNLSVIKEQRIVGFFGGEPAARPFNILRAQIQKKIVEKNYSIIGITSAAPSVGKTFVACNLSAAMSSIPDFRTTLVDLDFRNPSVSRALGLTFEKGFNDYLNDESVGLHSIGQSILGTQLTVYPSSRDLNNPGNLFLGEKFKRLLALTRGDKGKHLLILDLPPVMASDDAINIAQLIDAYLIVVSAQTTTAKQVKEASAMLAPARCLGSVLNKYAGVPFDTYGYGANSDAYARYYATGPDVETTG